jgi:hypothetical protein
MLGSARFAGVSRVPNTRKTAFAAAVGSACRAAVSAQVPAPRLLSAGTAMPGVINTTDLMPAAPRIEFPAERRSRSNFSAGE